MSIVRALDKIDERRKKDEHDAAIAALGAALEGVRSSDEDPLGIEARTPEMVGRREES
jgi:hypothetical protein